MWWLLPRLSDILRYAQDLGSEDTGMWTGSQSALGKHAWSCFVLSQGWHGNSVAKLALAKEITSNTVFSSEYNMNKWFLGKHMWDIV